MGAMGVGTSEASGGCRHPHLNSMPDKRPTWDTSEHENVPKQGLDTHICKER